MPTRKPPGAQANPDPLMDSRRQSHPRDGVSPTATRTLALYTSIRPLLHRARGAQSKVNDQNDPESPWPTTPPYSSASAREIYRQRPDVMAIVHSHSPDVIPFSVTKSAMKPIYHLASFLFSGVPVYEIRKTRCDNDLLIRDIELGRDLAKSLGKCSCVLMRGHGMTVVGDSLPEVVFRAVYSQMNARLQTAAGQLQGPIEFLSEEEGKRATATNRGTVERPWELWKARAMNNGKG